MVVNLVDCVTADGSKLSEECHWPLNLHTVDFSCLVSKSKPSLLSSMLV